MIYFIEVFRQLLGTFVRYLLKLLKIFIYFVVRFTHTYIKYSKLVRCMYKMNLKNNA